jgi:hypothetical protein
MSANGLRTVVKAMIGEPAEIDSMWTIPELGLSLLNVGQFGDFDDGLIV